MGAVMSEAVEVGPFSVKLAPYQKASVALEVPKAADFLCNAMSVDKSGDVWSRVRVGPKGAYISDWFQPESAAPVSSPEVCLELLFFRGFMIEFEFENRGATEASASVTLRGIGMAFQPQRRSS